MPFKYGTWKFDDKFTVKVTKDGIFIEPDFDLILATRDLLNPNKWVKI